MYWTNNEGTRFGSKNEAFIWLNEAEINPDIAKIYCAGELRYAKTPFGIFSYYEQTYIRGKLKIQTL